MSLLAEIPAAVLAGGLGTRLRPHTHARPKPLVPVNGQPFLDYLLRMLVRRGFRRVLLCVGHQADQIMHHVGGGAAFGLDVAYSHDSPSDEPRGTAAAIRNALALLGEAFWVINGDTYLDTSYEAIYSHYQASPSNLIAVYRNENRYWPSNVRLSADGRCRYSKNAPLPGMRHVEAGVAILHASALLAHTDVDTLWRVYERLAENGELNAYAVRERFYEINTPAALAETAVFLAQQACPAAGVLRHDQLG